MNKQFSPLLSTLFPNGTRGTINDHRDICIENLRLCSWKTNISQAVWFDISKIIVSRNPVIYHLTNVEIRCLTKMYKEIYRSAEIFCYPTAWKTNEVTFNDEVYGSAMSRSVRSSNIMAFWCGDDGNIQEYRNMYSTARPGKILFYLKHTITVNGRFYDHVIAKVDWFKPFTSDRLKTYFGKPVMLYRYSLFERPNSALFMPVQRIFCKFAHSKTIVEFHNAIVCIPRYRSI